MPSKRNKALEKVLQKIRRFRDERDWMQFHAPKNLAISVTLEASELLEHFQWKTDAEAARHVRENKAEVADEIADIAVYLFELSDNLGIDLLETMSAKIDKNAKKYPVAKSKGRAVKYNRL